MPSTSSTWQNAPAVRAILARLSPDDLRVILERPIVGDDHLALFADEETHEVLEATRQRSINEAFGMTFAAARDAGCAREWLDAYIATPDVSDVLADHFGNPRKYGRTDAYTATLLWRAAAHASRSRAIAA